MRRTGRTHFTDDAFTFDFLLLTAGALGSRLNSVIRAAHRRLPTRPRPRRAAPASAAGPAAAAVLVRPVMLGREPVGGRRGGRDGRRRHAVGRVGAERVVAERRIKAVSAAEWRRRPGRVEPMPVLPGPQLGPLRRIVVVVAAAPAAAVREPRRAVKAVDAAHQSLRVIVAAGARVERCRPPTVVVVGAVRSPSVRVGVPARSRQTSAARRSSVLAPPALGRVVPASRLATMFVDDIARRIVLLCVARRRIAAITSVYNMSVTRLNNCRFSEYYETVHRYFFRTSKNVMFSVFATRLYHQRHYVFGQSVHCVRLFVKPDRSCYHDISRTA